LAKEENRQDEFLAEVLGWQNIAVAKLS